MRKKSYLNKREKGDKKMLRNKRMFVVLVMGVCLGLGTKGLAVTRENMVKTEPEKMETEEISLNQNRVHLSVYGYQVDPLKQEDRGSDYYVFLLEVYLEPSSQSLGKKGYILTNWGNQDDDLPPTLMIIAEVREGEIDTDENLPQPGRYVSSEEKETFVFRQEVNLAKSSAKVEWTQDCPPWISEIKRLTKEKVIWEASVDTNGIISNPEAERPQSWGFSFLVKTEEGVSPKVRVDLEAGFWRDRQWPWPNEIEVVKLTTDWLKLVGSYPVKVKVLGLPKSLSSPLYLDKRFVGSLSEDSSYQDLFIQGSSHLLKVNSYVPSETGKEGMRYYSKESSQIVRGRRELLFHYRPEYYLTVLSDFAETEGEGWYEAGSEARAKVKEKKIGNYVFQGWSQDASGNELESKPIYMNKAKTAKAEWKKEAPSKESLNSEAVTNKESPLSEKAKVEDKEEPGEERYNQTINISSRTEYTSRNVTLVEKSEDKLPLLLIMLFIFVACVSLN